MERIKLGTLYLENSPFPPGSAFLKSLDMKIGNTQPGLELSWLQLDGFLLAEHLVCTKINWNELNRLGYTGGRVVSVDGRTYLCRLIDVGNGVGRSEWDDIADAIAGLNERDFLVQWNNLKFWGRFPHSDLSAAIIGGAGFSHVRFQRRDALQHSTGFLPILIPVTLIPKIDSTTIDQELMVVGSGGDVSGILIDFTDYDLVLDAKEPSPLSRTDSFFTEKWAAIVDKNRVAVTRNAIMGIMQRTSL